MGDIKKIRIILWSGLSIVTAWLLYSGIAPAGKISYGYDFRKEDYFIRKLTPEDRLRPIMNGEQKVVGDPAYFILRTPRTFDKARLEIKFKNPDNLPVIEAGVLADNKLWRYQAKPLFNQKIEDLTKAWHVIREGESILLERKKTHDSIKDFLSESPSLDRIATYNYDLNQKYYLAGYEKSEEGVELKKKLRGNYQFLTYLKDEPLDLALEVVDLNKNRDSDPVEVRIYQGNSIINSKTLEDDGNTDDDGKASKPREFGIRLPAPTEGVYKVEVVANDDIVTQKISTNLDKLSFINRLWLFESEGDALIFSDSRTINAQTINPGSLQEIYVGKNKLTLSETYRQYSVKNPGKAAEIRLSKDDIIISGDGVFAFSQGAMFNPGPKKVTVDFDADEEGVDFVLANYDPGFASEDGWLYATAEFNLKPAYREFYKYSFLISVPGLKADDNIDDGIMIDEIKVDLEGTSLLQKLRKVMTK